MLQVRSGDRKLVTIRPLLLPDLPEAPRRTVVGLDRPLELVVDRGDLTEDPLCLRPLGGDGARIGGRCTGGDQACRECYDDAARLSFPRANTSLLGCRQACRPGPGPPQGREASSGFGHPQPRTVPRTCPNAEKTGRYAAETCRSAVGSPPRARLPLRSAGACDGARRNRAAALAAGIGPGAGLIGSPAEGGAARSEGALRRARALLARLAPRSRPGPPGGAPSSRRGAARRARVGQAAARGCRARLQHLATTARRPATRPLRAGCAGR